MEVENIVFAVVVITAAWVFFDARSIGVRKGVVKGIADMNPSSWLIACIFLWIIAFPLYLAKRSELKRAIKQSNDSTNLGGGLVFCRTCGKQLHSSAVNCPHCGSKQ